MKINSAFAVWNCLAPDRDTGPKALPYTFDWTANGFSLGAVIEDDFLFENESGVLKFVQGVFIDNSAGDVPFALTFNTTRQKIQIPAGYQATMPAYAPDQTKFTGQQIGAAVLRVIVPVIFLNIPTAPAVWKAIP